MGSFGQVAAINGSESNILFIMDGSECWREQPLFGLDSISPEIGVYNII
jgi:hypothetical protein